MMEIQRLFRAAPAVASAGADVTVELKPEELLPGASAVRNEKIPEQCVEAVRIELEDRISRLEALRSDHVAEIEYRQVRLAETEAALKTLQAALGAMMLEAGDEARAEGGMNGIQG